MPRAIRLPPLIREYGGWRIFFCIDLEERNINFKLFSVRRMKKKEFSELKNLPAGVY
jgi:hypothetical protein